MKDNQGKTASKGTTDPVSVTINEMSVIRMLVSVGVAALMLIAGGFYRTDWLIMLAVSYVFSAFARSYLMLPARISVKSRSRMVKGYQKYRIVGMILSGLYLVLLLFIILKRKEGFFYPIPVLVITAGFALFRIAAMLMDFRTFARVEGPYTAGLRLLDLGETVFAVLLLVHLALAIADGKFVASGFLWLVSAIIIGMLMCASAYMVVFADGEIRNYSAE